MAEYEACILGLRLAVDMGVQELLVLGGFRFAHPSNSRRLGDARFEAHPVSTMLAEAMSTVCVSKI